MAAARIPRPRLGTVVSTLPAVAAAWLLGVPVESQSSGTGAVSAWLTTVDRANLLAPQAELSFQDDSGSNPLTIDVDAATAYQVMDGFGASLTESSAWLVHARLTADHRHDLFMRLFDRTEGIGLSYLRQPIGASDFALSHYSYDDMPPGQTDFGLAHFSIDHDRAYILPALREALAINPDLRIMASPWSSTESASYPAASAVDGNARTRWSSAFSDPQWLRIDLGSRYQLTHVVLNWELAFSVAYDVQVSDDAVSWRTVYATSAGKGGTETITLGTTAATGRYLRVYCRQRTYVYGQQWGHSLWEVQTFGTLAAQ